MANRIRGDYIMNELAFQGVKVALINNGKVLTILTILGKKSPTSKVVR